MTRNPAPDLWAAPDLVPAITYGDLPRAIEWLQRVLVSGAAAYRALDHEGYQWEISQRGRDLAAHRWQLPPGVTSGTGE